MSTAAGQGGLLKRVSDLSDRLRSLETATESLLNVDIAPCPLLVCRPLGYIRSAYATRNGTPRQGTVCPQLRAELRLSRDVFTNPAHSLEGIHEFSHVWLIFWFHLNGDTALKAKIRPPRLNGAATGVFSTRSPHRPNPLGLTLARLERVEKDTLVLTGVDLIDGTPVLDIKPFISAYDCPDPRLEREKSTAEDNTWVARVDRNQLLRNVVFTPEAYEALKSFHERCKRPVKCSRCLEFIEEEALLPAIDELLKSDLRSVYRKTKCSDRIHFLTVDRLKLSVWYGPNKTAHILEVTCNSHDPNDGTEEIT